MSSHPQAGRVAASAPASGFRRLSERILARAASEDERERLRSDLVLAFGLAFLVFGSLIIGATYVAPLPPESRYLARLTTPVFMAGMVVSVLALRVSRSVRLSARITCASIYLVVAGSVVAHGSLHSPVLCIWVVLPIVAGLLDGRRAAAFWSVAILVFLWGLHDLEQAGLARTIPLDAAAYFPSLMANMAIACAAATASVMLYESIDAGLRRSLEEERRKLRHAAGHDPLTDLPNRRLFEELQDVALRRAARTKQKAALIIIDLDDFKPINDDHGHGWGDQVLQALATRLRAFTRVTDSVARLGGDEFAILVELLASEVDARVLAERLHVVFTEPLEIATGHEVRVSASIGIALYPDHGESAAELYEAADAAMYAAKEAGGDRFRFADD